MTKKVIVVLILFATSNFAQAAAVSYTDRTTFETAVGSFLLEDFDAFGSGETVTSLFSGLVNFTSPTPPTVFFGGWTTGSVQGGALLPQPVNVPAPPLQIEFSTPVLAIGADLFDDYDGTHILSLRVETNGGNFHVISESSDASQAGFLGFLSLEGIVAAEFFDNGRNVIEVDNLTVAGLSEVPVPAAIWLFGTALLGLVGFGKRIKAA